MFRPPNCSSSGRFVHAVLWHFSCIHISRLIDVRMTSNISFHRSDCLYGCEPSRSQPQKGGCGLIKKTGAWHFVLPCQPFRRPGPAAAISWGFVREGNIPHVRPKAIQYNQEHTNQKVFLNSKTGMKTPKLLNGKQCLP